MPTTEEGSQKYPSFNIVMEITTRQILHWNYQFDSILPPELLTHGKHLKELYFKENALETLPHEFGELQNLTNLYLNGNRLETLPSSFGQLQNLIELELSQNLLTELPNDIGYLISLKLLDLSSNALRELPDSLKKLSKLRILMVKSNYIRVFPECITELLELEVLDISRNLLKIIPKSIANLTKVSRLNLSNNRIKVLPKSITKFGNLHRLDISANCLESLPSVPFASAMLAVTCDRNPELSCLPFLLGSQQSLFDIIDGAVLTMRFQATDCFARKKHERDVTLTIDGEEHFAKLPSHFQEVGIYDDNTGTCQAYAVPRLFELCMRMVHSLCCLSQERKVELGVSELIICQTPSNCETTERGKSISCGTLLPRMIADLLEDGVNGCCTNPACDQNMFTHCIVAYAAVNVTPAFPSGFDPVETQTITEITFCSLNCLRDFVGSKPRRKLRTAMAKVKVQS